MKTLWRGIIGMLALVGPVAAIAGPVPDTVQMAVIRYAVSETPLVKVKGSFVTLWALRPRLDSAGVWIDQRFEGPNRAMRTAVPQDKVVPIPWQEISSLETDRAGSKGRSTVIGGLIGVLVGSAIVLSRTDWWSWDNRQHEWGATMALSLGAGLGLGYLVGRHGAQRTIYPPPSSQRP